MAKATLQSIREQSDKLHARWTREFAGKPRHTRDLVALEKLVEKTAALVHKAKQIPGEKGDALEKVVRERLKLYTTERDAIAEVKYDRPGVAEVHQLGIEVDRVLAAWRRHFGGRDRRTRDLQFLDVLIARLQKAVTRLRELAPEHGDVVKLDALDGVVTQLEVMRDERSEIDKAKRALTDAERPGMLLTEAQQALDRYRVLLGGQPRASCSLANLDAIIHTLRRVKIELQALTLDESQAKNLPVLEQNLAAYTEERARIAQALAETSPRDRGGQLATVANRLFQIYQQQFAGQSRSTRDLKLLSDINDRLSDIAELSAELDQQHDEPLNRKNRTIFEERTRRYEAEWMEIAKAKAQAAQKAQAGQVVVQRAPAPVAPQIRIEPKK